MRYEPDDLAASEAPYPEIPSNFDLTSLGTILGLADVMLDRDDNSSRSASDDFFTSPATPAAAVTTHIPLDLEDSVREVLAAVRRLAGRPRATMSPRVRAELAQARHLLDSLGAAIEDGDNQIDALQVADDGTWFQTPEGRVDVARRGAVRRILVGLCKSRIDEPTKALSVDVLFEIGWPGERIPYESQVRRVYTAVWTLRTLGLENILLTRDEGYLLDPKRTVRLAA